MLGKLPWDRTLTLVLYPAIGFGIFYREKVVDTFRYFEAPTVAAPCFQSIQDHCCLVDREFVPGLSLDPKHSSDGCAGTLIMLANFIIRIGFVDFYLDLKCGCCWYGLSFLNYPEDAYVVYVAALTEHSGQW